MSNRELAKSLIDQIPENKLPYVIAYLQEILASENDTTAERSDSIPFADL
jgi:hypothetical protein